MFSDQHGYDNRRRGGIAGKTPEQPRGPMMDERNRTMDVAQMLRDGGFSPAADVIDKMKEMSQDGMPKLTLAIDELHADGQDKAAEYLRKMQQKLSEAIQPRDTEQTEAGTEPSGTEGFEPRALAAEDVDAGFQAAFETQPNGERGAASELSNSGPREFAEGLSQIEQPIPEHDLDATIDQYSIESGTPVAEAARFQPGESPFAGLELDPHSHEAEVLKNMEALQADMQDTIKQVSEAMDAGDPKKAAELTKAMAEKMQAAHGEGLPEDVKKQYEDVIATLDAAIAEADPEESSLLRRLGSGALDFIPVAGPAKMCVEAAYGETLGGEKLEGWGRGLHATEGIVCLVVDCTGGGAAVTKGGKAIVKGGKIVYSGAKFLTRSAAAMRKMGAARKVYEPAFKAGKFLARHPSLGRVADKGLGYMISGRKRRMLGEVRTAGVNKIKETMNGGTEQATDLRQLGSVRERPGMVLHTPPDFGLADDEPVQPAG